MNEFTDSIEFVGIFRYLSNYIKRNFMWIILIFIMSVIHLLYMVLIDAKMTDVLYAAVLDIILFLAVMAVGFTVYLKRIKRIGNVLKRPVEEQPQLPEPGDDIEKLYAQLLENQDIARREAVSNAINSQSRMKDYYSMWVHQIKTPISAMKLLLQAQKENVCELLPDDEEDSQAALYPCNELQNAVENECRELTDNISSLEDELFRIEEYVNMALQYQRVSSSQNDLVLEKINLDKVIRDTIRKYAKSMIRKDIRFIYNGVDECVYTDEKWFAFILGQILSNAIKYTSQGAVTIDAVHETNWCFIRITDTGIGIRTEDLPRIFEKGYTGYNGHADKKATGIGLYLCKQMADKLGHTIRVESEVGCGTTVWIGFNLRYVDMRD